MRISAGLLPKRAVRVASSRPPPPEVPPNAKWVHIDPRQETLVAYQGDQPVFATLVSTGAYGRRTSRGLYRVWSKELRDHMHGADYDLEEVPFTQFFHDGQAIHGTFWHDRFGRAITHGCVNLSMADAQWLFNWAPPPLPAGWRSVSPTPGEQTLWVLIQSSSTRVPGTVSRLPGNRGLGTHFSPSLRHEIRIGLFQ